MTWALEGISHLLLALPRGRISHPMSGLSPSSMRQPHADLGSGHGWLFYKQGNGAQRFSNSREAAPPACHTHSWRGVGRRTHWEGVCRPPGPLWSGPESFPGRPDTWIVRSVSALAAWRWPRCLPSLDLHCLKVKMRTVIHPCIPHWML